MNYAKPSVSITKLLRLMLCFYLCTLLSQAASAHNKVVVIPMAGDDVPAELTPTMPIANVDTSQSDYTIGALTAIDNITKLEWQRMDDGTRRNWDDAWDYCADLDLDNHDDWRLPTIKELQSIVDYGSATAPLIDQVAFTNTDTSEYWSASSSAFDSRFAWNVRFLNAEAFSFGKTNDFWVRCVR